MSEHFPDSGEANLEIPEAGDFREDGHVRMKIIGVGGAGNNAVDRLKLEDLRGEIELAVVNTDHRVLNQSPVHEKLLIGRNVTRGLGSGGEAELGREAAHADRTALAGLVVGCDVVFILGGLGGGTSSGAMPVLAEEADRAGCLTIAMVTLPFEFEGARRRAQADEALAELRANCHAVIPLPNNILLQQADEKTGVLDAFALADTWIARGVRGIASLLYKTGLVNVDFASLQAAFAFRGGRTLFGVGEGSGEDFAAAALGDLELCPLLHTPEQTRRADSLIVNLTGGIDLTMTQVNEVMRAVTGRFGSRESTTLGVVIDEDRRAFLEIMVIGVTSVSGRGAKRRSAHKSVPAASSPANCPVDSGASGNRSGGRRGTGPEAESLPGDGAGRPVHDSKLPTGGSKQRDQEEFSFEHRVPDHGDYFPRTEKNEYDGEDLDTPTYLRRGIKISLT